MRDEDFNRYRPMFPQSKVWKAKTADQPARPVGPLQPTGQTGQTDRSDRSHLKRQKKVPFQTIRVNIRSIRA